MVDTMVVVKRGDKLGERYRRRITEVYVRSFAADLRNVLDPGRANSQRGTHR